MVVKHKDTVLYKWLFKCCPHCKRGDMEYRDDDESYHCLQCGCQIERSEVQSMLRRYDKRII